jgi:hypothetical protein
MYNMPRGHTKKPKKTTKKRFIKETLDFFVLKAEVEFKNINFAFVYLNDSFANNLCLKNSRIFFFNKKSYIVMSSGKNQK